MASKPESPTEPFKRALAHAARSLAETPDLEVVFSGEGPSLIGNRAVLPHPPRDLNAKEAARIRGLADQMALRLAHHDAAKHARARPGSPDGQAAFEAIEQARLEAIGSNALGGVRANLTAALEARLEKQGLTRAVATDRQSAPMAEILSLLVRERLTGDAPPDGAKALVDILRADIEARAGKDLDRLAAAIDDQAAFAKVTREILRDLDLGEDMSDATEQSDEDEGDEDQNTEASEDDSGEGEGEQSDGAQPEQAETSDRESEAGDEEMVQSEQDGEVEDTEEAPEMGDGAKPARPDPGQGGAGEPPYKVFTTAYDEVNAGRGAVRRRRADPAAGLSGPAVGGLLQRGLAPRQQAAAPPAGPAEPRLDLRPGGGDAGRRPPDSGDHRPHRPPVVQAGGGRPPGGRTSARSCGTACCSVGWVRSTRTQSSPSSAATRAQVRADRGALGQVAVRRGVQDDLLPGRDLQLSAHPRRGVGRVAVEEHVAAGRARSGAPGPRTLWRARRCARGARRRGDQGVQRGRVGAPLLALAGEVAAQVGGVQAVT